MREHRIAIATALVLLPASLCAQWFDWRTPGIPRTADGKPNLTAPAPKMPDGRPDLSGMWQPEANPYRFNLIQDLKDERVFRPAATAIFMAHVADCMIRYAVLSMSEGPPGRQFVTGSSRLKSATRSRKIA